VVCQVPPYSRSNWNDTGVDPDLKVSATYALQAALKLAARKLSVK